MSKTKVAEMISTNMKKIDQLKEELKTLPAGHLLCLKNGKYTRWEQVTTGRRRRIPKKNVELAIKLARKMNCIMTCWRKECVATPMSNERG